MTSSLKSVTWLHPYVDLSGSSFFWRMGSSVFVLLFCIKEWAYIFVFPIPTGWSSCPSGSLSSPLIPCFPLFFISVSLKWPHGKHKSASTVINQRNLEWCWHMLSTQQILAIVFLCICLTGVVLILIFCYSFYNIFLRKPKVLQIVSFYLYCAKLFLFTVYEEDKIWGLWILY